jgi:hypothetical protein
MGRRVEKEFSAKTIKAAFVRQSGYCAGCGTRIAKMGNDGAMRHNFGERAEAHHVLAWACGWPGTCQQLRHSLPHLPLFRAPGRTLGGHLDMKSPAAERNPSMSR